MIHIAIDASASTLVDFISKCMRKTGITLQAQLQCVVACYLVSILLLTCVGVIIIPALCLIIPKLF